MRARRKSTLQRLVTEGIFPLVWIGGSLAFIAQFFSLQGGGLVGSVVLLGLFAALTAKSVLLLSARERFGHEPLLGLLIVLSAKALEQALVASVCGSVTGTCAAAWLGLEFLAFAFLAIYHTPVWMAGFALYAFLLQLGYGAGPAVLLAAAEPPDVKAALPGAAARLLYDLAFGVGFGWFLERARLSRDYAMHELERLEREAKNFRLQGVVAQPEGEVEAMSRSGREEAEKRAVQRLRQKEAEIAAFVKRTLRCYTAVIFRLDATTGHLELRAWASDSKSIYPSVSLRPVESVIGLIFRDKKVHRKGEDSRAITGLPYYTSEDEGIHSFLGAPIIDGERCLGVIAVDSCEYGVFDGEEHKSTLELAARMVYDAVQNEEMRSRQETEALQLQAMLELSREVTKDLAVGEVCRTVTQTVYRIVPYEFAAVALWDDKAKHYRIEYAATGNYEGVSEASAWAGSIVPDGEGTVVGYAMRQNSPYLIEHYRERDKSARLPILGGDKKLPEMDSILAVPLYHGATRVGCMVMGAQGNDAFEETERKLFGILASLFATALLNARKHRETEVRATTDALTGLANRNKFKEFLAEQIANAKRSKQPLSLLLMDIDHFKKINDTYGHPAGDAVLKQLAEILKAESREGDLPARYGGEEFLVVLVNTPRKDATRAAERMRKAVEKTAFVLPDGRSIRVTLSIGAATFPDDTSREDQLAEKADQALYGAKAGGRNRVQQYCDLPRRDETTSWVGHTPDAKATAREESKWRFGS